MTPSLATPRSGDRLVAAIEAQTVAIGQAAGLLAGRRALRRA